MSDEEADNESFVHIETEHAVLTLQDDDTDFEELVDLSEELYDGIVREDDEESEDPTFG